MHTSDVLVIGAGIAGASAAYEIQAFANVILLEREAEPGYHATGRSAATFAPGNGNRIVRALSKASYAFYAQQAGGLADHSVLVPRGLLLIAREDQLARLTALYKDARAASYSLKPLDAGEVLAHVPVLRPGYAAGALYDPDTMDLDVTAIHHGYLQGFLARGGRIVTDAEVLAVALDGAPWSVETRAGRFETSVVVNAAGAWADEIARMAGLEPVGLVPTRRTAFVFDPSTTPAPDTPLIEDVEERFYFKPEAGRVLASPADETPVSPCDVQPEDVDVALAIQRIERATRMGVERVVQCWAGLRTFAPDRTPVVGMEETVPGFLWLAGQGGYGIQTAPALARAAAGLLVQGVLPDDLLALGVTAEDLMPARLRAPIVPD